MPRLGTCQWRPHTGRTESEKSHTIIPFTKSSFSVIERTIAIPKTFLKALTGNIARVHKSSSRDLIGNPVSGLGSYSTPAISRLNRRRLYLEARNLPANLWPPLSVPLAHHKTNTRHFTVQNSPSYLHPPPLLLKRFLHSGLLPASSSPNPHHWTNVPRFRKTYW